MNSISGGVCLLFTHSRAAEQMLEYRSRKQSQIH